MGKVRIGEWFTTDYGDLIVMTNPDKNRRVRVNFINTGYGVDALTSHVLHGKVKDRLFPTVCGVGYLGYGAYVKDKKYKMHWYGMLGRCYGENTYHTYDSAEVCEEWHNLQWFAEWCETQKGSNLAKWQLDKDILGKSKLYSPDNCCFVPAEINTSVLLHKVVRGEYPIGVHKVGNKFVAQMGGDSSSKYLGIFNTPEEAFHSYKSAKESSVKYLAEKYKDQLDIRVYEALMNFTVSIED